MTDQSDHGLTEAVERLAITSGASLVGFADVEGMADLPRAVALAVRYAPEVFADPEQMPNPAFAGEHLRLISHLRQLGEEVAARLRAEGYQAIDDPAPREGVDRTKWLSPFSHKMAATRAGLGWIGKCDLFVSRELGPAVRLWSVLTDAPLAVGQPVTESECGECTVCVDACPVGAANGRPWFAGLRREEFFDVFACHRSCRERERAFGVERGGCAVCMAVCPRRPQS
jgi:epoxyqueuosine reductase QueG